MDNSKNTKELFRIVNSLTECNTHKPLPSVSTLQLMLKEVITACLPTITCIANMSLTRGDFITDWKLAIVRPLFKKPGSKHLLIIYRPVSSLSFLSKLVERCMLQQLLDHCTQHNLIPDFQSSYHKNHTTETSLLKLTNDILWGFESEYHININPGPVRNI